MSKKDEKIARLAPSQAGGKHDSRYLGFFSCFNGGEFYDAHDVLEALWLSVRKGPNDLFYKGLIQLAGAFVHLQKNRLRPAVALFNLAAANLAKYPAVHEDLDVAAVLEMIQTWREKIEADDFANNPLISTNRPSLILQAH